MALDTVLLLAPSASGRPGVRQCPAGLSLEESRREFHTRPTLAGAR